MFFLFEEHYRYEKVCQQCLDYTLNTKEGIPHMEKHYLSLHHILIPYLRQIHAKFDSEEKNGENIESQYYHSIYNNNINITDLDSI